MPIVAADIQKRYSVAAAAGDTTAGTAAGSLGDQISTTQIPDAAIGNIFDDISGAEEAAGDIEYRCIFVLNNHATLTLTAATVQVLSQTSGGASVDIAVDNIGPVAKGSASAQAAVVANEQTAPGGVGAFGAGPIALGNLAPGECRAVWIRRTITAGAGALNPDGFVLRVAGDTLP